MSTITLPGLIDPHVHLRDPGNIEKEDFYTGTAAALAGGYTTLLDMPNNKIPITTEEVLSEKISIAREKIVCDVGFYFGSLGDNRNEFAKVADKTFGLKLFLNQTTGGFVITEDALSEIYASWSGNGPILVHAEDEKLELVIRTVQKSGRKTHICHVPGKKELELIIAAKDKSLPITCGVTPHHLFLTDHDAAALGPFGKMKPPLRAQSDVDFLWQHIDAIDLIESDHAPHTLNEKNSSDAPYGVPNLETTLPLLLTAVHGGKITIDTLVRLCFENPQKIFTIPGAPNTFVEVDAGYEYTIKNESLHTKSKWSPFNGWKARGKVRRVSLHGTIVFENDTVLSAPGSGHILTPSL